MDYVSPCWCSFVYLLVPGQLLDFGLHWNSVVTCFGQFLSSLFLPSSLCRR